MSREMSIKANVEGDLSSDAKRHSENCNLTSVDCYANTILLGVNKEVGSIIKGVCNLQ